MSEENVRFVESVQVNRIFLNLENPRFEAVDTESEAIEILCNTEDVYPLAVDIVEQESINPMERVALVPVSDSPRGKRTSYTVVEGNRRICALKLLIDPDLAPAKFRKKFEALAADWTPITTVAAVILTDFDDVTVWLKRMHEGALGGIGRRSWNADQKQRFSGSTKNQMALDFLDYCEEQGFISKDERKGTLTTVQRFVSKEAFKEHFGLDTEDPTKLRRTRPQEEFDKLAKTFIEDLKEKTKVNSRMNKPQIAQYARETVANSKIDQERIEPEPLQSPPSKKTGRRRPRPKSPKKPKFINHANEIDDELKKLKNAKLLSLYASIVNVELEHHTPLISVGVWAFFETLTACAGRDGGDFVAFLSHDKMNSYGFTSKDDKKAMSAALQRIQRFGNETKHHRLAAAFSGEQLNNDMEMLKDLIVKCSEEAISNKS